LPKQGKSIYLTTAGKFEKDGYNKTSVEEEEEKKNSKWVVGTNDFMEKKCRYLTEWMIVIQGR